MYLSAQNIKAKMNEFSRLFSIERNIFQRFVIVYKYIRFLNSDPLVKDILQKILDDTAKYIGEPEECLNEDEFLDVRGQALFSNEFWLYYNNLEIIYGKMRKIKNCRIKDKNEFMALCNLFSKPYSSEMLKLSFKVVNSEIFDRLDQECFFNPNKNENKTYFDEDKSILYINNKAVKINIQDKVTNAHKILKHIFITNKENVLDDFFYSEIAEDEFNDLEYKQDKKNWQKYHTACKEIKRKIEEQANIKNFIIFNTGRKGRIKINKKYLKN